MSTSASGPYRELLSSLGAPALNALFPQEFEVYMMSLELVNSKGEVENYFSFPVLPEQIVKSEKHITNVKKTMGGVVSLTNNTFVPEDITINGTFGRTFKVLIGRENRSFRGIQINVKKNGKLKTPEFNASIKTGFGCTKILQNIHARATQLDDYGMPYRLYFYNPTLGESHLVEPLSLTLRQDKGSLNAMWGYSLMMRTLAPAQDLEIFRPTSLTKTIGIGAVQKGLNILTTQSRGFLREGSLKLYDNIVETANLKFISKK